MKFFATSAFVFLLGSSALPIGSAAPTAHTGNQARDVEKRYAILDNDWSANGFVPFLIALDGGIDVLGLTSSTANSWAKQCALHGLATLEAGGLDCIPVFSGADWPLLQTPVRFSAWETLHGSLVWKGVFAPYEENTTSDPTSGSPDRIVKAAFTEGYPKGQLNTSTSAANFMVEQVRKYPGKVSIYAAGALTNIALAVRMDPQFASLAKELVIMGGYVDTNMFQASGTLLETDINTDINLITDPESAKIALSAAWPSVTIAGNVANQVQSTQEFLDEVAEVNNTYTTLFHDLYGTEFPFWDETAAALMVDPSIAVNSSTLYMDVDTAYNSPGYGTVRVYQKSLAPEGVRNVTYVNKIDGDRLKSIIKHALQNPPQYCS